ncbi:MAG TPA: VTT domain-containing protein [Gemmataceae bacterium]|jgi:membrane-associated protein|nr:VTT domain-containing protein [Gemmataceae bacterium]
MHELWQQLQNIALVLFNNEQLLETLSKPEYILAAFIMLNLIVFAETGLLVFCLPGDSLLVTVGLIFHNLIYEHGCSGWLLPLLLVTLALSAIVGDSVAYAIGYRAGPRVFSREKSFFFRKDHLLAAQAFYEKHGGITIVLARFIPFLRAFAPVVAGVGRMQYGRFLFYNIFGGIGWVCSMILFGYFLTPLLDPVLKPIFGEQFRIQKHVEVLIVLVALVSVAPIFVGWLRRRLRRKPTVPANGMHF